MKLMFFLIIISLIFFLKVLTFPSIHHITSDETLFLNVSEEICKGNFTMFFGSGGISTLHPPLFHSILCITSPIHKFNLESAEIVSFIFSIFLIIGWYFSIPSKWQTDKKKFVVFLFGNSLLWVYSLRVLMDVPLAFFLSLGMLHLYLFYENKKMKNYFIGLIMLSLALLTKENAIAFLPIFFIYIFVRKKWNLKNLILLFLPLIPYLIFIFFQHMSSFHVPLFFEFHVGFPYIPYANLPTIFYMFGVFGFGVFSCLFMWKWMKKERVFKNFLLFSLILYIVWEIIYDFVLLINLPRYHTTLIPFFSLIISESSKKSKKMSYLYYSSLIFTIIVGFLISFYFHTSFVTIWKKYSFLFDLMKLKFK